MTITVTPEELEEYPEIELPEVDFDAERLTLLLEVVAETKDAVGLQPFNVAAGWSIAKMSKELKEQVDDAAAEYKKQCDEREAKILKARADKAKEEAEAKSDEEKAQTTVAAQPRDTLAQPIERRV
jgi:hypothetical protein